MTGKTLFEKIWDDHVIADLGDDFQLLFIDRHMVHDLSGRGLVTLAERGLEMPYPELTFANPDHSVSTLRNVVGSSALTHPDLTDNNYIKNLSEAAARFGVAYFAPGADGQGISHVMSPELGIALPGSTMVCGDSHTCTVGALGALGWGIGQSEVVHVMATQTSVQSKPKNMRITLTGEAGPAITAKDIVLYLIGRIGATGGRGYAVEYTGPVIDALAMEGRFTLCNMTVEFGARFGLIAPDQTAFDYLEGLRFAPNGADWDNALAHWQQLPSDGDAKFDRDVTIDITGIEPQITWGTSPEHVIGISGTVPDPEMEPDEARRRSMEAGLAYTKLTPAAPIAGHRIDWVFIGSCTNSRISDLRAAAELADGRTVAANVTAWVVPGSVKVKRQAEAEGLDRVFLDAGFFWGEPGCSICGGHGDQFREKIGAGTRSVATTNRNFAGRNGPGSLTHIASPAMAVAAAIEGCIADPRKLGKRR